MRSIREAEASPLLSVNLTAVYQKVLSY